MINIISKYDAVTSLVGGKLSQPADGIIRYFSGQTPPTQAEIDAEVIRLQAEYDSLAYSRARANAYPDFGSQLNKIYDDGITKWKSEMVDPIKAKFPKPT